MFKEHDCVILASDLPRAGLTAGDLGTILHVHQGGAAYEVEFMTLRGRTVAVVTLQADQVRPISEREVAHARELTGT